MTKQFLIRVLALGAVALLILTGCAQIPTDGPVDESEQQNVGDEQLTYTFNPAGPAQNAGPEAIIMGFITASTGVQDNFAVARSYMTDDQAASWDPLARTTVFSGSPAVVATDAEQTYSIQLGVESVVDESGVMSVASDDATEGFDVTLTQDANGQWRISDVPDGIFLDTSQFRALYASYPLYFYDVTFTHAVPDVRWFISAPGQTAAVVQALIDGPASYLEGAVLNSLDGVELSAPSVPVTDGTVAVDLTPESIADTTDLQRQLMQQQLELTLNHRPRIDDVQMTTNLDPVDLGSPDPEFSTVATVMRPITTQVGVDPDTNQLVYYFGSAPAEIEGLANVSELGPQDPTMTQDIQEIVFLAEDRTQLINADVDGNVDVLATGEDLLAPTVDYVGWAWTVSTETSDDAGSSISPNQRMLISSVSPGVDSVHEINFDHVTTGELVDIRVSGDGARLAMIVEQNGDTRVLLSGIIRDADAKPIGLADPIGFDTEANPNQVRWYSSEELLLGRTSANDRVELQVININGNTATHKPMLGMTNFSTSTGGSQIYAEAGGEVYLRVGHNWRAQDQAASQLSFPG